MENCLLCLEINKNKFDCIKSNSSFWKEYNIQNLIEKHFWIMEPLLPSSWICFNCWQALNDFHKFYIRIEKAHKRLHEDHCVIKDIGIDEPNLGLEIFKDEILITDCQQNIKLEEDLADENISLLQLKKRKRNCNKMNDIEKLNQDPLNTERFPLNIENFKIDKVLMLEDNDSHQMLDTTEKVLNPLNSDDLDSSADYDLKPEKLNKEVEKKKNKEDNKLQKASCDKTDTFLETTKNLEYINQDSLTNSIESKSSFKNDINTKESVDSDNFSKTSDTDTSQTGYALTDKLSNKVVKKEKVYKLQNEEIDKFLLENFKMSCELCQIEVPQFVTLVKHFQTEHKQRGYAVCCNRKFYRRGELRDHVHARHVDPNKLKCNTCGKVMSSDKVLKVHLLRHLPQEEGRKFSCTECGKRFVTKGYLNEHITQHHSKTFKKNCKKCGKTMCVEELKKHMLEHDHDEFTKNESDESKNSQFKTEPKTDDQNTLQALSKTDDFLNSSESDDFESDYKYENVKKRIRKKTPKELIKRQQLTHEQRDKFIAENFKLSCALCQSPMTNFATLNKHFETEHRQRGYAVCCNKKIYRRTLLVEHVQTHIDPNKFKCNQCGIMLSSQKGLRYHKLRHLPEEGKKFHCTKCGKNFASTGFLNIHINRVHLKKYFKICEICGKSLYYEEVKKHMLEHEGKSLPLVYCEICGVALSHKKVLKLHMKLQHLGGKQPMPCPICKKILPKLSIKRHIKTVHTDDRHTCTICGKGFKTQRALKEHVSIHTGIDLYSCSWCSKSFKSSTSWHHHRRKHHPVELEAERKQKYLQTHKIPAVADINDTDV